MPLTAHRAIINLGKELGYINALNDMDLGVCFGISVSWMKARLIHQEDKFRARIQRIINENNTLVAQIESVKAKVKNKETLTPNDIELLEILALYDSITLHQVPYFFSDVLSARLNQRDIENISSYSQSKELEETGGLREIYSQANIYSREEMAAYFSDLADTLNTITPALTEPVCFVLRSYSHAISVEYDVRNRSWTVMDINLWPPKSTNNTTRLSEYIRQSWGYRTSYNAEMSCFNTHMFTKKMNK